MDLLLPFLLDGKDFQEIEIIKKIKLDRFEHFLLTRFNVPNPDWMKDKNQNPVLDEEWLDHRFEIFEKFTLPSVAGQTNRKFTWLVFFDEETPGKYRYRISEYQVKCGNFKPVFVSDWKDYSQKLQGSLSSGIDKTQQYLLTSRLDNDDCIHREYIHDTQQAFREEKRMVIDYPVGYALETGQKPEIRKRYRKFGHFISLVEAVEADSPFETVLSRTHDEWSGTKSIELGDKAYWLEIIHEKNLLNKLKGEKVYRKSVLDPFSIQVKISIPFVVRIKPVVSSLIKKIK